MRIPVGYSPWPGWDCSVVVRTPRRYAAVLAALESWAERLDRWPVLAEALWMVRAPIARRFWRRHGSVWWEYRAR